MGAAHAVETQLPVLHMLWRLSCMACSSRQYLSGTPQHVLHRHIPSVLRVSGVADCRCWFMGVVLCHAAVQDYCALTLPNRALQPPLANHMTMLRPLPGSSFPQVVLLLHRASLALHLGAEWEVSRFGNSHSLPSNATQNVHGQAACLWVTGALAREHGQRSACTGWSLFMPRSGALCVIEYIRTCAAVLQVRLAVADDVTALTGLLGSMSNATQLQEAFLHAVGAWV